MIRGRTPITSPRPLEYTQTPMKYINAKRVAGPEKNFIKANKSNLTSKYETLPLVKKIEKMEQRYHP